MTGAMLNQTITSAVNFFLGKPIFFAVQTVAQTLTIGGANAITFSTEVVDRDSGHSTTTNTSRYTAATAGWYRVNGVVAFSSVASGTYREARIGKNGTAIDGSAIRFRATTIPSGILPVASASILVYLNGSTDYVELYSSNDSAVAISTAISTPLASSLTVEWVSL